MNPATDRFGRSLEQLTVANVGRVGQLGARIQSERQRATRLSYGLYAFATLLALLAIFSAARISRERAQLLQERSDLTEERNRLTEQRVEELSQFAGRVAHDLKNSLGAIGLWVQQLQSEDKNNPRLSRLGGSLKRLTNTIDGLLDFARAGAQPDPKASSRLQELLDGVVADVRGEADKVNAELLVEAGAPLDVACPPGALTSVLANLLRNAVKYVVEGPGPLRRVVTRVSVHEGRARVEIEDTGPGIPAGQESVIFEPYMRLKGTRQPGLGLGLATVKRIVEAYRGAVGVQSVYGQGSCFWFELPLAT
jgi:signal transduction histidine kinase